MQAALGLYRYSIVVDKSEFVNAYSLEPYHEPAVHTPQ